MDAQPPKSRWQRFRQSPHAPVLFSKPYESLIGIGYGVFLAGMWYSALYFPHAFFHAAKSQWERLVSMIFVFAIAAVLFLLRTYRRLAYGIFECVVATFLIWQSLKRLEPSYTSAFALLGAGCYLLVRAFDNIAEGRKQNAARAAAALVAKDNAERAAAIVVIAPTSPIVPAGNP